MTWQAFHSRGETLRSVVTTTDARLDGILPTDLPGVHEHFRDDLDLVSALLLKWHARLSGNIERAMVREPMDLERAVATAWRETAEQMPGVRLVVDRYLEQGTDEEMVSALERARHLEWTRLALAAGLANTPGHATAEAGRRVEELARTDLRLPQRPAAPRVEETAPVAPATPDVVATPDAHDAEQERRTAANASLVERIKAALAA